MKTITIGFSSPLNNPFPIYSWIIKLLYNTPYSHTYMKFHSESLDRDIIYESVGVGVRFVGAKFWEQHAEIIKEFELYVTEEQYKTLMTYCVDHAGIEYGKLQAIGIYVAKLFKMITNPFKNGEDLLVCSEVIGKILSQLGYTIDKDFDLLTPKDIYEILNG